MRYPFLIRIHWAWSIETILIEKPGAQKKSSSLETSEIWEEAPFELDYSARVLSHEIVGTWHKLQLQYMPGDNPKINRISDCWGISTITFDTSKKAENKAEWEDDNPGKGYSGTTRKVMLVQEGDDEFLGYVTSLRRKRRQTQFKQNLLKIERSCALTRETELNALEAAHIKDVQNNGGFSVSNGFLLRADLHRLFDAQLLSINSKSGKASLSKDIPKESFYWKEVDGWKLKKATLNRVKKALLKRARSDRI